MPYKNLISLKTLSNTEISQILDIAAEMKRIIMSRVKRGPQLIGKVLAVAGDFSPMQKAALTLSVNYLSGISTVVDSLPTIDDLFSLKLLGADFIVTKGDEDFFNEAANKCGGGIINYGGEGENPLEILLYLFSIKQTIETLNSIDVSVLGNINADNTASDLCEVLSRFESRVSVYSADKSAVNTFKQKNLRVYSDVNMAVSGADAVVDLGCADKDNFTYYADYMGLTTDILKLAQQNVPLFNRKTVFDKESARMVVYPFSKADEKYSNLTAVTMALLYLLNRN
jgi:aspartate carbamoyltransferase catalytic subunit